MDRQEPDDALARRRERRLGRRRVEVEGRRVDVREERPGPQADDRARRGPEAERRREHAHARSDAQGAEREEQGVGARRDADRVRHAAVRRHRGLEALDVRSQHEGVAGEHLGHRRLDFAADLPVLRREIEKRDVHRYPSLALMSPP